MLSSKDKLILENLKNTNPEAYDLFLRTEAEHKEVVKSGCHDIRNIITVISGAYQLLDLTNKELSALPRWNQLGRDIKYLIEAFNRIGYYRYADNISPEKTSVTELTRLINEYNATHYPAVGFVYNTRLNQYNITTDINKLFEAVAHLIDNAVEASDSYIKTINISDNPDYSNTASDCHISAADTDIIVSLSELTEPHLLEISVTNYCKIPDDKTLKVMSKPFTSNKSNRIGLGLAIAAKTTDALNGTLDYEFNNNTCTVKISIPYEF